MYETEGLLVSNGWLSLIDVGLGLGFGVQYGSSVVLFVSCTDRAKHFLEDVVSYPQTSIQGAAWPETAETRHVSYLYFQGLL